METMSQRGRWPAAVLIAFGALSVAACDDDGSNIPPSHEYTVAPGDTLSEIADKTCHSSNPEYVGRLAFANNKSSDPSAIDTGEVLTVPGDLCDSDYTPKVLSEN